jgi:hypothetical protein
MRIRELIDDLEQYPDDYIAVVSKDSNGCYVVIAIEPIRYHKDQQVAAIDSVLSDRRKTKG